MRRPWVVIGLLLFIAFGLPFIEYRTDDTYIFLRYATNLVRGDGLVFNPGDPVYGFTSALWLFLLVIPIKIGVPPMAGAKVLGFACAVAAILGFAHLARRRLPAPVAGPATVAFAVNAWLVRWSAAAMESALTTALVVWGLARHADEVEDEGRRFPLAALLLALGVLARPEVSVLLALCLLSDLSGGIRARRRALAGAAVSVLVVLPWHAYALRTFGVLMPETAAAKGRLSLAALDPDPLYDVARIIATTSGLEALLFAALVATWIAAWLARRGPGAGPGAMRAELRRHGVAIGWLAALPILYLLAGFDVLSRYALPIIPVVILYGFAGLGRFTPGDAGGRRMAIAAWVLASIVIVQNGLVLARVVYPHTHRFSRGVEECLGGLGRWCRDHTPPGTTVAIADIGAFGYYSDRRVLDLAGLVSPELIPIVDKHPIDEIAAELLFADQARPEYLVDRHPDPERLAGAKGGTFEPITWCRIEGLGVRAPEPIVYTLYRLRWDRYDAARAAAGGAAETDNAEEGGP